MKKVKIIKVGITTDKTRNQAIEELEEFVNKHNVISWRQSGDHIILIYTFIYEDIIED